MLFLEIFLTLTAWNRGYKAWALLPGGIVFGIGYLIGTSSPDAVNGDNLFSLIWLDILAIVVLVVMIGLGHEKTEPAQVDENAESTETKGELTEH